MWERFELHFQYLVDPWGGAHRLELGARLRKPSDLRQFQLPFIGLRTVQERMNLRRERLFESQRLDSRRRPSSDVG